MLGLLFLAGPLSDLWDESLATATRVALALGVALFVAIYLTVLPPARWLACRGPVAVVGALALLPAIAIVLLAAGAPPSFSALFVYVTAASGILLPARIAAAVVAAAAVGVGILGAARGDSDAAIAATVLTVVSIGALMADDTDYRERLRTIDKGDAKAIAHFSDMHALKLLARAAAPQFDRAFAALFA